MIRPLMARSRSRVRGRHGRLLLGVIAIAGLLIPPPVARAQTSYPMLARVHPVAVQRGTSAEISVGGVGNFAGATSLLFEGTGLTGVILVADSGASKSARKGAGRNGVASSIRVKITATPDVVLGPREFRVITPRGASSVGQIVVVAEPVVVEEDAINDDPEKGQLIPVPSAVAGVVGKVEDVDWYAFRAEAGQTIVFSLWGNRLEDKIHDLQSHLDPILQLFDATGRELAANDNHNFADPMLAHTFKAAGTYKILVRDTTYDGNPNWSYVLQVSNGPFAKTAFPMAVKPGATAELNVSGYNIDEARPARAVVPSGAPLGPIALSLTTDRGETPPVPLVATNLPLATEAGDAPSEFAKAQASEFPVALSGRLGAANDRDGFRFESKKGTLYSFEIIARRVGSSADPVLRLINSQGAKLAEADDIFGKDPRLEWTAPNDGPVMVEVRDLHSRGGAGFGYVLLAEAARPDFLVTCDPDKVNVGAGSRVPLFVKVERRNGFTGAVSFALNGLPENVTASALTIPSGGTQGLVVVSATVEARPGAAIATLQAKADSPGGPIVHPAVPREEIYLPGGGRGLYSVSTMVVAATEPSDIAVEASPKQVVLKSGESATIDVSIVRHAGFTGPVNLAVELSHLGQVFASPLPAGVTLKADASKTLIASGAMTGKIVLEAAANAPPNPGTPICVMGHVSINFVVKTGYCSDPIMVRVVGK
ncbi:MAG: putative pre-peptidase [Planctomycetota bacterium]|nr:putative pre-peptidase [Planctomycetota bacterium]